MKFPQLIPSNRTFAPAEWPVSRQKFMSGATQRILYQTSGYSSKLRLTYANRDCDQMAEFMAHYDEQLGTRESFKFNNNWAEQVWGGWDEQKDDQIRLAAEGRWRYVGPPVFRQTDFGIGTIEVGLVQVPGEEPCRAGLPGNPGNGGAGPEGPDGNGPPDVGSGGGPGASKPSPGPGGGNGGGGDPAPNPNIPPSYPAPDGGEPLSPKPEGCRVVKGPVGGTLKYRYEGGPNKGKSGVITGSVVEYGYGGVIENIVPNRTRIETWQKKSDGTTVNSSTILFGPYQFPPGSGLGFQDSSWNPITWLELPDGVECDQEWE